MFSIFSGEQKSLMCCRYIWVDVTALVALNYGIYKRNSEQSSKSEVWLYHAFMTLYPHSNHQL